jgi:pectin methylesterase-like acyl-CoA thioesterase
MAQIPLRLYRRWLRGGRIVKVRSVALTGVTAAALAWVSATLPLANSAAVAAPSVRCVGQAAGCYRTVQAAVDGARGGDSILISAGVFSGGVTIDKSVQVVGAGAGKTIIAGGGPVLTIGR